MQKNLSLLNRFVRSMLLTAILMQVIMMPFVLWYMVCAIIISTYLLLTVVFAYSPIYTLWEFVSGDKQNNNETENDVITETS